MTETKEMALSVGTAASKFVSADEIRARFSSAMSRMYREEVPQYGVLLDLVAEINAAAKQRDPRQAAGEGECARLSVERHGAIRLGTARELHTIRRMFAVMAMAPVSYYDLSTAGVPVHSTAFRPITEESLTSNPFRVFTSLLRLELIADAELREEASELLRRRNIFTPRALTLTSQFEQGGGLSEQDADEFVSEMLETFRWHSAATVSRAAYDRLRKSHRLIADVVCFKGPHINHLTPRTLDIDAAQREMPRRGISAKAVIEGPPRRKAPILLRQTSFTALEEAVTFVDDNSAGAHTARFGEIEQRGVALTRTGRALYDRLLEKARNDAGRSEAAFKEFPDDYETLRREGLAFFRYEVRGAVPQGVGAELDLDSLIASGVVAALPIIYEDFLPVSAAGIFQSNLGDHQAEAYDTGPSRALFERALGATVLDEFELYEAEQKASLDLLIRQINSNGGA